MEARLNQLSQLRCYVEHVDKDVSMILQNLQWDRKLLLKVPSMSVCSHDKNHKLSQENLKNHEEHCFLKSQGYMKEDLLLPDPLDINATTLVKLNTQDIMKIINDASIQVPLFKKGDARRFTEPLSLERLQLAYTSDERRVIHDAVVKAVPSCHDLADLALSSTDGDKGDKHKEKSRTEILAELRDMKRRRTKYRVAAKTRNYSDVLRDVIKTQMEFYSDAIQSKDIGSIITKEPHCSGKNMAINRESTECETFVSKNIRRIETSMRTTEDRRIRSDYYGSSRRERKREYNHSNRVESSVRNGKERRDDYCKQNIYRRNRENESRARDKSKSVYNTRSEYRERGEKRTIDRESYTDDTSSSVKSSESCSSDRDRYSRHRKRIVNEGYNNTECEKRRKRNDYYNSNRDEAGKRNLTNIEKNRLDPANRECRSESYNINNRSRKAYCPIKVEKVEPRNGEIAPRDEYNASSYSNNHTRTVRVKVENVEPEKGDTAPRDEYNAPRHSDNQTKMVRVKVEKTKSMDEKLTNVSSSSSSSSSSTTNTEDERSIRRERDKTPYTERKKARSEYLRAFKFGDKQSTNKNGGLQEAIKTEPIESEPRYKETHNVDESNRTNIQIKEDRTYSHEGQGRYYQATGSKSIGHGYKNKSIEERDKPNRTVYYGSSTEYSGTRGSSLHYTSYGEVKRSENVPRSYDMYSNDESYRKHAYYRERKRTHRRQS